MNNERKILYISVAVNFIVGIIIGIILFYGQMRTSPSFLENSYSYDKTVTLTDFFRLSWLNLIWMFSIFIAHSILSIRAVHPIIAVRGCVSSFSVLYILSMFGIREAAAAVIPQCLSVLPLLMAFSVSTVIKQRENLKNGCEPCSIKRYEAAFIFLFAMLAAAAEVLFFRTFCIYLF